MPQKFRGGLGIYQLHARPQVRTTRRRRSLPPDTIHARGARPICRRWWGSAAAEWGFRQDMRAGYALRVRGPGAYEGLIPGKSLLTAPRTAD